MISNALTPASCSRAGCSVAIEALLLQASENHLPQPKVTPTYLTRAVSSALPCVGSGWQSLTMECSRAGHGPRMPLSKETKAWKAKVSLLCAGWKEGRLPPPSEA